MSVLLCLVFFIALLAGGDVLENCCLVKLKAFVLVT